MKSFAAPHRRPLPRFGHARWLTTGWVILGALLTGFSWGQEDLDQTAGPVPLYEREPFDRITLDAENNSAIVEIFPIDSVDRSRPVAESNKTLFTIRRLVDPPDRQYRVSARDIVKFELFHELLLQKARQLVAAKSVDEAFPYLARLLNDYPDTRGLDATVEDFFYADARSLFEDKRYDESLRSLDEVFSRNPNRPGLSRVLQRILDEIMRQEFQKEKYASAWRKLEFARSRYGPTTQAVVASWEARLKREADQHVKIAEEAFQRGDAIAALTASRHALRAWPGSRAAEELNRAILAKYPRVRVGVSQAYHPLDSKTTRTPRNLHWAVRRAEPLLRRALVEFEEFTGEGGRYRSPLGKLAVAPDRTRIGITLDEIDGYELCRSLLRIADPADHDYSARWAEFLESVFVPHPNHVEIRLTRPFLRPEGLLPRTIPSSVAMDTALRGGFTMQDSGAGDELNFRLREERASVAAGVTQILERTFDEPEMLTAALLAGDIDVIDRVPPADVARLAAQPNLVVVPYQIPTVHFLVCNDREPLLRSSTFRRGLLYGIHRAQFLQNLRGNQQGLAQVISAPLPPGKSAEDPLGYAYDRSIVPRDYDPSLSQVLLRLAQMQKRLLVHSAASPTQEAEADTPPLVAVEPNQVSLPPLVIARSDSPVAKAACAAIAFDWRRIGFDISIRELPAGAVRPEDDEWDLLYVEATIEDPFVDFPELVLGELLLGRHGSFVWQATRGLQEALDLPEVRQQFARIHKLAFDHTPLLPLWQIVEHVAYRKEVIGIGDAPVTLYEHVSAWRFAP